MSQFGDHGAATGPYGLGNAPPPPMDPPPSKVGRKRSRDDRVEASSASTAPHGSYSQQYRDTPRRKVSANQRRKLRLNKEREKLKKERAALERTKDNGRSRSRSRENSLGDNKRHRAYWSKGRDGDRDGEQDGRWDPHYEDRQPLHDARQFTPDQIVDETAGRLSAGKADPSHYRNSNDDAKDVHDRRDQWGNDNGYSWSPRRLQPPHQYDHGNGEGSRHDDHYVEPEHGAPAAHASHPYHVDDEVVWDEDMAPLSPPRPMFNDEKRFNDTGDRPYQQRSWQQNPWQGEEARSHRNGYKPYRGKKRGGKFRFEPRMPYAKPAELGYGRTDARQERASSRIRDAHARAAEPVDKLLQDDPSLVADMWRTPDIPDTVFDLRAYDSEITALQKTLPRHERFINGNGKAAPYIYGSIQGQDLGLCFSTFCTTFRCEIGVRCAWRHHPLTKAEREWIITYGRERGKQFLERLANFWANPEVPVPGAAMHDK